MSTIEDLGFAAGERVVVVHVDDLGMSEAANSGALAALAGVATCGSIMVPCPGFEQIAKIAQSRPELDLGVHLTLNAEYETFRWGPVCDDVPGLQSPDGGMWRTSRETIDHASEDEVERELRGQVDRALAAGIDVTHVDSHMGTVFDLKFVEVYVRIARDYEVPAFVPRPKRELLAAQGLPPSLERYIEIIASAEEDGFPVFDHLDADSLSFPATTGLGHNTGRVEALEPGLSYLITHCAQGDDQLRSITEDWQQRDEERQVYSDGSMQRVFDAEGVQRIGMRPLRDLLRRHLLRG